LILLLSPPFPSHQTDVKQHNFSSFWLPGLSLTNIIIPLSLRVEVVSYGSYMLLIHIHSFIAWTMVNLNLVLWGLVPIPKMVSASILHLLLGCTHSPYSRPMCVRGVFEICLVAIPVVCYLRYNSTTPFVCWVGGYKTISHSNVMFTGQSKIGWVSKSLSSHMREWESEIIQNTDTR